MVNLCTKILSDDPRLTAEGIRAAIAFAAETLRADVVYPVEKVYGVKIVADESVFRPRKSIWFESVKSTGAVSSAYYSNGSTGRVAPKSALNSCAWKLIALPAT